MNTANVVLWRGLMVAGLLAAGLAAQGCVVGRPGRMAVGIVYVASAPPPPRVEVAGPAPGRGFVWVAGHWSWSGTEYVWVAGRWARPPRGNARWVPGHWRRHPRHGWYWVEGRWR